jgi:hypothetical protein
VRSRGLIALLTYLGPLARGAQRYLWRLRGLGQVDRLSFAGAHQPVRVDWLQRQLSLGYWSEQGHEKEALLASVVDFLLPRKYLIAVDPGWNRWDLEVYRGIWSKARLIVAAENHGGPRRLLNVRCEVRLTRVAQLALLGFALTVAAGLILGAPEMTGVGAGLGLVNLTIIVLENLRLGRVLTDTLDIVAQQIGLRPVPARPADDAPAEAAPAEAGDQ